MKIAIAAGHTKNGVGYGACGLLKESEETRKVANELLLLFRRKGHTAINCTVDKAHSVMGYLSEQVRLANESKSPLFICVHFNCSNSKGKGVECYTWKANRLNEAIKICDNISMFGFKNRGIKDGSNLYVIRKTTMNAILVEVCFIDNEEDVRLYKEVGAKGIAYAIYNAIVS